MKIDLTKVDITDFTMKDCVFGGDDCIWIFPHLEGVKWGLHNEVLRSSIWRKSDGELISPGFKKFFNWEQCPELHPAPNALSTKIQCVEKLDGSCLIVSKYKGELIIRTRRALAETMLNGHEIALFKQKYPDVFNCPLLEYATLIFEWLTPTNIIVVRHEEADIKLIGCIDHATYKYYTQENLDNIAANIGVQRPKYFAYDTIQAMLDNIKDLKGEEGVVVYYGNGQHIRKVKSDWYLSVHNFRNAMNLKNIVELYLVNGMPIYQDFCTLILNQFQYEGFMMAQPLISQICDAMKTVKKIIDGMRFFIERMHQQPHLYPSRKEMAKHIIDSYGTTNRADIVFTVLDGKEPGKEQYKKLLFQSLVV